MNLLPGASVSVLGNEGNEGSTSFSYSYFLSEKWLVKDLRARQVRERREALRRSWGNFLSSSSPQKSPCSDLWVNWRQLTSSVFFLSKNSSFGYSEKLSDIKLDAIKMLIIFQQLYCTKRFWTWFSPICKSNAAVPMQAKPSIQNQSCSLLFLFYYDQNAYLYHYIKLIEYVKAHNHNCSKNGPERTSMILNYQVV